MRPKTLAALAAATLLLVSAALANHQQKRKNEEPKSQVAPLPPEPPMALASDTDGLDFHISRLQKTGGLSAQIRQSLNDLIRDTRGETIVKLRAFVAGSGDARRVQAYVTDLFTEHKLPLPTISILQVGALGEEAAQVVIEAVVSTHKTVNPNGLAFFYGQKGGSLTKALARLKESTQEVAVDPARVLACTCFTSRIDSFDAAAGAIRAIFPNTEVNVVQAVRDPANDASTCEAIAQLTQAPHEGPVVLVDFAHATLVHSPQLIFTGLQLTFGNFLDDAHEAFSRLQKDAASLHRIQTPVEVNAFALDNYAASALRKTVSLAPGTFTVQNIQGLPAVDAVAGIEAVLAPNVESAVILKKRTEGTILR